MYKLKTINGWLCMTGQGWLEAYIGGEDDAISFQTREEAQKYIDDNKLSDDILFDARIVKVS